MNSLHKRRRGHAITMAARYVKRQMVRHMRDGNPHGIIHVPLVLLGGRRYKKKPAVAAQHHQYAKRLVSPPLYRRIGIGN